MPPKYRILYVNNEIPLPEPGKRFLEKDGQFSVESSTSAPAALSLLGSKDYDAIVSGYRMPEMDGIEFLKKVRSSGNPIPFIIFTGQEREEAVMEAISNGADFCLRKDGSLETQFFELAHKIRIAIEHQRTLEKILSLNRLYSVLSASNKAIVHLRTKDGFFSEICRILVETGGFRMAWIGLADPEYRIIRPVASAGHTNGYLDTLHISTEDVPSGRGPTGTAYRDGKYFFSNDIASDPRMVPWRENALKHGYLASAAFPFAPGTKNAGVLTIYAPVTGFFDDQTLALLEELSDSISFALETLDQAGQRAYAEKELEKSELKYRQLFQTACDGILILDGDTGEITDANPAILEMLGYPPDYFVGRHLWDLGFLKDSSLTKNAFAKLKTDGYIRYEDLPLETRQGKAINGEFVCNAYFVDDKKVIQCNIRDITGRRKAEEELKRKNEDLHELNEELTAAQEELRQNIEELTLRERDLQAISQQRQLALDAARLGWWHYDPVTRIASWDERCREIFGVTGYQSLMDEILAIRMHPDDLPGFRARVEAALDPANPRPFTAEYRISQPDGSMRWIETHGIASFEGTGENRRATSLVRTVADISESKYDEDIIRLTVAVFRISSTSHDLHGMLGEYAGLLQQYTGCSAIGIRLLDDYSNIPYQANIGFSEEFLKRESPLTIKTDSCMCINVIKGTTDPSLPFYTNEGSFYINATTKFLATVSEEEKGKTRNMCNTAGYESVALIPIRRGDTILGLLHLADEREKMVPERMVRILENVALSMGSPILRMIVQEELKRKNEALNAAYEEITSTEEELRQNIEELSLRELELIKSEADLKEALVEKEILLSEVHHRVKNNLTAFISLLSLDGTYEDTEGGRALRKDLQNRARSMALIHETLYRTGKFSKVDMEVYLTTLIDQIAGSYADSAKIRTAVDVHGVTLDLARATTAGLIVNELVTNSFKYAFPPGFDCMAARGEPCTIRVSLAHEDGTDVLAVADNGRGLPAGLEPLTTKSLGLKLVTFLARHQLRAEIAVRADKGAGFVFRLKNTEDRA